MGWIVLLAEDVLGLEPMSVAIFCRSALGSSSAIDQRSSTIGPEPAQGSQTSGTQRMSAATVLAGALLLLGNPVGALASPTPISVVREVMSSGPGTVPRSVRSVPSLQMPVARGDGYARRTLGVTTGRGNVVTVRLRLDASLQPTLPLPDEAADRACDCDRSADDGAPRARTRSSS